MVIFTPKLPLKVAYSLAVLLCSSGTVVGAAVASLRFETVTYGISLLSFKTLSGTVVVGRTVNVLYAHALVFLIERYSTETGMCHGQLPLVCQPCFQTAGCGSPFTLVSKSMVLALRCATLHLLRYLCRHTVHGRDT